MPRIIAGAAGLIAVTLAAPVAAQTFDFEGAELDPGWEVVRPNPDNFIVEDGELLIVASEAGSYADETVTNVFEYTEGVPEGDWVMEVVLSAEFQTALEALSIGVTDDADAAVFATLSTDGDKYYGWSLNIGASKRLGDVESRFDQPVATLGCNVCGPDRQFQNFADSLEQPIRLQLERTGRRYTARARLGGPDDEWIETLPVTMLRKAPHLILFAAQRQPTGGESLFLIDSLSITPK